MLSFRIAARFLRKSPVQTSLIVIGIAVGLAVVIFIGSLILSLQDFLIDQTLGSSAHLTIESGDEGESVNFSKKLRNKLNNDSRVTAILPNRQVSVIVRKGKESEPVTIVSGRPKDLNAVYKLAGRLDRGSYDLSGADVLIGKELAKALDISVDEQVELTLPNGESQTRKATGLFDLGARELNDGIGFAGAGFGRSALGLNKNEYGSIQVQLDDVFQSTTVAKKLRKSFPSLEVKDWQKEQADLLSGLSAQTSSTIMIQVFVIIAVALGIASTLSISAIQKTSQIGILKALGMTDARSGIIFLWEGAILGFFGTVFGLALGSALIVLFQYISERSGADIFPIQAQPAFIALAIVIGFAVALASAILPSRRTSKLNPIDVIQSG